MSITFADLLRKHEGAGNWDTLFGHSQLPGRAFEGVRPSQMTIGQLKEFTDPSGSYGQWVKQQLAAQGASPRVSTPLGAGQIVGTTLRNTATQLGLSDDTVFNPEIQTRMINHLAKQRVKSANTMAGKRAALRSEWEGFKAVPDEQLDQAIHSFQSGGGSGLGPTVSATKHLNDPEVSNIVERDNPLSIFASGANRNASQFTKTAEALGGLGFEDYMTGAKPVQGEALPHNPLFPAPMTSGQALSYGLPSPLTQMHPAEAPMRVPGEGTQLGYNGTGVPPYSAPEGFGITPSPSGAAPVAEQRATSGAPGATTSTSGVDEVEEESRSGLFARMAEKLFPESEEPGARLREFMGALGVGLGQMSGGSDVNLQPYFESIAARRQAAINSQGDLAGQQINAYNAETSRLQAGLAREKFEIEKAKATTASARASVPAYDEATIAEFLEDPNLSPLMQRVIDTSNSGDIKARDAAIKQLDDVLVARAKEASKGGTENTEWGNLLEAISSGAAPDEIGNIMDRGGMGSEDLNAAYRNLGKTPPALATLAETWLDARENNPALAKAIEKLSLNQAGFDQSPREHEEMTRAYEYADKLDKTVENNSGIHAELLSMEDITKRMIDNDIQSGPANEVISSIGKGISQLTGGALDAWLGERVNNYDQLGASEATLALMIAKPMMEGAGAISEGERELMLNTIAQGGMTNGTRLQMIQKLKALHEIDRIVADAYGTQLGETIDRTGTYSSARSLHSNLKRQALEVLPEIRRASQNAIAVRHKDMGEFAYVGRLPIKEQIKLQAPKMTQEQYDMFKSAVPATASGQRVWQRRNDDGTLTLMVDG